MVKVFARRSQSQVQDKPRKEDHFYVISEELCMRSLHVLSIGFFDAQASAFSMPKHPFFGCQPFKHPFSGCQQPQISLDGMSPLLV